MAEGRRPQEGASTWESMGAHASATERYDEELRLLHADEATLQSLRERLNQAGRLSLEEEQRFVALESAIAHSRERLPTLEGAKRKERAAIDVTGLVDDWQPLMEAKLAAYDGLSALIREVWNQTLAIGAIHQAQEALLEALPDDEVRRTMLETFWIDGMTMRARMAGNLFPPQAWTDFLNNPLGYRVGPGSTIAQNDPGCCPLPARLVENIVAGQLWATKAHRV